MLREIMFNKHYWKTFNYLPPSLRKLVYYSLKPILRNANQYQMLDYFHKSANSWEQYWSGQPILTNLQQEELFSPNYYKYLASTAKYAEKINEAAFSFDVEIDFSRQAIYTEFAQRLPEMLLMRVDKMGMANSIEPRVPFLDHRIVEMSFALDFKKKIPDGKTTKFLLKKASEGIIPNEIINRKKQGFAAPVTEWLRKEWYGYTKDKLLGSRFVKEGIFNRTYIEKILELHRTSKKNFNKEIYSLLSFSLWEEKFIK